jgi:hypothetical protein
MKHAWILALVAGLVGGTMSWLVGEQTYDRFKPPESVSATLYIFTRLNAEMAKSAARNGAATFGALGCLLGLSLGLAGGLSRRSAVGATVGAIVGIVLGSAAGALPALGIMPWTWNHRNDDPSSTDLFVPLLVHLGLWCAAGAAAGLAYAAGQGNWKFKGLIAAALRGLIGAAIGTVVFELVGAFEFPMDRTTGPFSATAVTRLMARLCVAGFVALAIALPIEARRTAKPVAQPSPAPLE